ncbi:VTT domain-containing protein [Falsibacillus pallidus]|uniref:VTT domain-containing protein n=1 Tax=Falsibacillus pallidus TaxID=493781 RepID=UPI003D9958E6
MDLFMRLIEEHGYIFLFFSLMLELIIIPIPNELLMTYAGFMVYQDKLNWILAILMAGTGGMIGVSVSYWIGSKLGAPFFYKYGRKVHLGPEKLDKMAAWNERYGKMLLIFAYFIPGVRHITSIFSGITKITFKTFAIFAFPGVFIWVGTFITLGRIFGPKWEQFHQETSKFLVIASIIGAIIYVIYFVIKTNRERIKEDGMLLFEHTFKRFKTFLGIKFFILFVSIIFIGLVSFMVGLIQDFIANEFGQFNVISSMVIHYTFDERWEQVMKVFSRAASWRVLDTIILLTVVWILVNGKNKLMELQFYAVNLIGAVLFGKGLHILFSYLTRGRNFSEEFPSGEMIMAIIVLGFFLYVVIRHPISHLFSVIMVFLEIGVIGMLAVSYSYLDIQQSSDIVGGLAFGGVWVSLVILITEIFRFIDLIKTTPIKGK